MKTPTLRDTLCLVRGGGDLATGVVYRLHRAGFRVVVLELAQPRVVRRMASVAQAVFAGEIQLEHLHARRAALTDLPLGDRSIVPVVVDPQGESIAALAPQVLIDARMAKTALDTTIGAAPLVIGLGPGFVPGQHCHAVIETQRGHDLGRVLWKGPARPNTGQPEAVLGFGTERVLRAPAAGRLNTEYAIGATVKRDDLLASVGGFPVRAPFDGVLRGLMQTGLAVVAGEKIGDVDPRGNVGNCFTISDKALAIGGGVLEATLAWWQGP